MDRKLCSECKHSARNWAGRVQCYHVLNRSLVDDQPERQAYMLREAGNLCGPEGLKWEKKDGR